MQRCACSIRALEIFVNDLAGLAIRQSKTRFPSILYRTFSTRPSYRQTATSHVISERSDYVLPFNEITDEGSTKQESREDDVNAVSLQALDNAWNAESVESPKLLKNSESRHDDFKSAEDVATQPESAEMKRMAKKMKGLEKKRKRQLDGVWAPVKRENVIRKRNGNEAPGVSEGHSIMGQEGAEDGGRRTRSERRALRGVEDSSITVKTGKATRRLRNSKEEGRDATKVSHTKQRNGATKGTAQAKLKMSKARDTASKSDKSVDASMDRERKDKELWQVQKASLERKFGEQGWQPKKRLSPDTLEGIRALHASDPGSYNTETLARHFQITPEAIRRILKSKWRPNEEEAEDRRQRWEKRGVKKWTDMAEMGMRPPAKWRALGVKSKVQMKKRDRRDGRESKGHAGRDGGGEVAEESFAGRIL